MLAVRRERVVTRTQTLSRLAGDVPGVRIVRGGERIVSRVRVDSRRIEPGDLFVAIPGSRDDGLRYADEALDRGAVGVLGTPDAEPPARGAWLTAEEPRLAAAHLAARAWGRPSDRLEVCGFTGTNGKTTATFLLRSIAEAAGRRPAVLGTLGAYLPDGQLPQARTTPEAPDLQESLAAAREQGCDLVAMEVSSHALDLRRVDGTAFAAAAFLNLSAEHLDWHGTMESYARSKRRLFAELLAPGVAPGGPRAVLNARDPWADRIRSVVEGALLFASGGVDADVVGRGVRASSAGTEFTLVTPAGEADARIPLPGIHNVDNALAAAAVATVIGLPLEAIASGLENATPPPGRFERVHSGSIDAFVDYAHTEIGVRRALEVARSITRNRVVVVLGCGGDRDRSKRPGMGRLAAELADVAIFTSDNPRGEDPREIVNAMLEGAKDARDRVAVVLDRHEALEHALRIAHDGDLVLALGKGHETYQTIAGVDHPFPEREILARLASRRDGEAK
jgi:UDP-N-acetylmuramoyl-L-alanyl-D-glutamate--2,6-diaminopimelate ligase